MFALYRKFKNLKLRSKLILLFMVTILIPFLIIVQLILNMSVKKIIDQTTFITIRSTDQTMTNITNLLIRYTDICNRYCYNSTLLNVLSLDEKYEDDMAGITAYKRINDLMSNDVVTKDFQLSIKIFFLNRSLPQDYVTLVRTDKKIEGSSEYVKAVKADGKIVWGFKQDRFFLARLIKDFNGIPLGVFYLEAPEQQVFSLINENNPSERLMIITDEKGNVISSNDRTLLGTSISNEDYYRMSRGQERAVFDYKRDYNYKVIYDTFSKPEELPAWSMTTFIPTDSIITDGKRIRSLSLIICAASLLVSCLIFILSLHKITKRINVLVKKMREVGTGKFTVIEGMDSEDEVGIMIKGFNKMAKSLEQLIFENYETRLQLKDIMIKNREAELYALQSQIHPHFLFNTLESIRMKLHKNNTREASNMILSLSKILRKSLNWQGEIITIKEEVEFVRNYLDIQKYRFNDKVAYDIQVPEGLENCKIPKLIIQPLVENAIKHGIEGKWGKGCVSISAYTENDVLVIRVNDDGVGMDDVIFEEIRNSLSNNDLVKKDGNIGIKNVHERIIKHYGSEYGVVIKSAKNLGTEVLVMLPYLDGAA